MTDYLNQETGTITTAHPASVLGRRLEAHPTYAQVHPQVEPEPHVAPPTPFMPALDADKDSWVVYAISRGEDPAEAEATSLQDLIAIYGTPDL